MAVRPQSFKVILDSVARDDILAPADREHLVRWADDDRSEEVWCKIWMKVCRHFPNDYHEEVAKGYARIFIREVLAARRVAEADQWPDFLMHAAEAESLAKFLSGTPVGLLPPMPGLRDLVPLLAKAAQRLREIANNRMPVSRERHDGLRPRRLFMRMISSDLREICGQPVDDAVCVLTDVAFPGLETTVDQVRSARKPTTRGGRSRHN